MEALTNLFTLHIAVDIRLGTAISVPHPCGSEVTLLGTQSLSCRRSEGWFSRHALLNDIKCSLYCLWVFLPDWNHRSLKVGWQEARWHDTSAMECWFPISFWDASYIMSGHFHTLLKGARPLWMLRCHTPIHPWFPQRAWEKSITRVRWSPFHQHLYFGVCRWQLQCRNAVAVLESARDQSWLAVPISFLFFFY